MNEDYKREYEPIFEEYTASFILERMLSRIDDKFDKREGSMIYDALAPAAIEFEIMYMELDWMLKNIYGDTADRQGLINVAKDRGLSIHSATPAIVKGEFNIEIPIGSRFNVDDLNYQVKEYIEAIDNYHYYELICEELGSLGSVPYAKLIPIDPINGLIHAFIVSLIVPGEEEEDTEDFRKRYYDNILKSPYGGNIDDYIMKVHEIEGVGGVKIYPVWNGGGTVKIVFTDNNFNTPTDDLVLKVQELIDPIPFKQQGKGIAPIGHYVTVLGAESDKVNFKFKISYKDGFNFETVKDGIVEAIELYFKELRKLWEENDNTIVRITRIETRLLDVEGILDIEETLINNISRNYTLDGEKIPVVGDIVEI